MSKTDRFLVAGVCVFLGALCFIGTAGAQMNSIYRFKGVNVPVDLKSGDKVLAKGAYDLEFLRTPSPVLFYVRVLRRGKILATFQGDEWAYAGGLVSDIAHSSEIPQKPTLKMTLNRAEKLLGLVFESGKNSVNYPLMRAKFALPYED